MAIVQALLAFVTRSLGKILGGLFGWAVVAIFGHTSAREKLFLSGLLAAAGAWPVLLFGVVAPKAAVFVLSFVSVPEWIPAAAIRPFWVGLTLLVPLAVGMVMAARRPAGRSRQHWARRLLSGFPITIGLSAALLITLVTVPALRALSVLRRWQDVQVPLVTDAATYELLAERVAGILERHGLPVERLQPPWWLSAPMRVLSALGGDVFEGRVPVHLAYFRGADLVLVLYPAGLLIRGPEGKLARAQGVVVEGVSDLPVWQTFDPRAQDIERQISQLWQAYRRRPADHRDAAPLRSRLEDIAGEIEALPVAYDEWQVVYRKALQVRSAIHGDGQLLDRGSAEVLESGHSLSTQTLSTRALIEAISRKAALLAEKEVALARAELSENVRSELSMVKWLAGAVVAGLVGTTVLLVAAVLAAAPYVRPWVAAVLLGGGVLAAGAVFGFHGWRRHVQSPLALTRKSLKDNWHWVKERLA